MPSILSELDDAGFVPPDFDSCLLNVSRQMAAGKGRLIGDRQKKIFLLLDGLGYSLLERVMAQYPHMRQILGSADLRKITTVFPSFTITAIASIDSGEGVSEHGLVGSVVPIRETGRIVNVLSSYSDIDAQYVVPRARTVQRITKRCAMLYLTNDEIVNSPYSKRVFETAERRGYISPEEFLVQLSKEVRKGKYGFIYAYYNLIDSTSHDRGSESAETLESAYGLFMNMERILLPVLRKSEYNLVITADHGQEHYTRKSILRSDVRKGLVQYLSMSPWGMVGKAPIVSVLPDREAAFEKEFHRLYGRDALLFESDELIRSGVFGSRHVDDRVRYRFGTHIMLPKEGKIFRFSVPSHYYNRPTPFGHHGGMSRDEMEIPLIVY